MPTLTVLPPPVTPSAARAALVATGEEEGRQSRAGRQQHAGLAVFFSIARRVIFWLVESDGIRFFNVVLLLVWHKDGLGECTIREIARLMANAVPNPCRRNTSGDTLIAQDYFMKLLK